MGGRRGDHRRHDFLVGHRSTRGSLEASWKYIVICSVGIALAFLGTVLVYLAALHASGSRERALGLDVTGGPVASTRPGRHAARLRADRARLRDEGRPGTDAQLAARRAQPGARARLGADVRGAADRRLLRDPAFQGDRRWCARPGVPRTLLVVVGLLSLIVAASLLLSQRDYKRMLAYTASSTWDSSRSERPPARRWRSPPSSCTSWATALPRACSSSPPGEILLVEGSSEIEDVGAAQSPSRPRGDLRLRPGGVLGFPPFSLFVSELNMLRAEFQVGLGWAAGLSLVCMAVIFGAVMSHGRHMLFGPKGNGRSGHDSGVGRGSADRCAGRRAPSSASRRGRSDRCFTRRRTWWRDECRRRR